MARLRAVDGAVGLDQMLSMKLVGHAAKFAPQTRVDRAILARLPAPRWRPLPEDFTRPPGP
jgi:hypothetical protein